MITNIQRQLLRQIPAVHELVHQPSLQQLIRDEGISDENLTACCQEVTEEVRQQILEGHLSENTVLLPYIIERIGEKVNSLTQTTLKSLINGTGVILHTNLGRARLSHEAQAALTEIAAHYSNLEFDLNSGERGSRHALVEDLICRLTGAEAALVCNNNASAVFLVLRELAQDKEVVVSRGELVEIGGSFRVSEIMRESGATLREIGTTNKTHLYDYERAISEETAMFLKVHTSNFVIQGFTATVPGTDLVSLAHQHQVPVFEDLGSGVLLDLRPYGIGREPTVQEVLRDGVDLVSFSGDKLLGGPQAGIIAGKKEYIQRLKKNQLMRSIRVDKFTLAALHATLKAYLDEEKAKQTIPTLRMILDQPETVKDKAVQFINTLNDPRYDCELVSLESEVGGGTMPEVKIPSWGVKICSESHRNVSHFAKTLRNSTFPVVGRIVQDAFTLDFRTIDKEEIGIVQTTLRNL
ncbi:L-seryl-tRNA(Sec) selenium transferase [Caldalkalibacillus salinus]|uniref:L-seryl-tRNA(Sec) selenium transferase n=1 Tax=Caldalkalibacillus salinus TaxID=2803787 RepID=UPI0019244767|nr:L-seryl-tRNA(Sec) selenium transferase [Caldalkalibacillus salinus]